MHLDPAACYRAVLARDVRYDGRFLTCVKTTGIYCRPICPARPPKFEHCRFVPTAAAAQAAGFRSCLRCRPESSPDFDAWHGTSVTVARALKMIEVGALDEDDVGSLADRLKVGERQLRRLFRRHIGAAPITVAQTRRVLLAKQLIHQTDLSMIEVALASGFGSVRRFNETFQRLYQRPPSELRRRAPVASSAPEISLLLPYRPPYDWTAMIGFLEARTINGLEAVAEKSYSRVIELDHVVGSITVSPAPDELALHVAVRFPKLSALPTIIARVRRMFDLSAQPASIAAVLSTDPVMAPLISARPGLRVPGAWDGLEVVVRAVLGQQISLKAATGLAGRVVTAIGTRVTGESSALTHAFPKAERFDLKTLTGLGIPGTRAAAIVAVAKAMAAGERLFDPSRDLDEAVARFRKIPGIGEWTAQYIAMRALGESDAFLAGDVGVRRQFAFHGEPLTAGQLLARAERWRPWRAYAVLHLWMAQNNSTSTFLLHETDPALATN